MMHIRKNGRRGGVGFVFTLASAIGVVARAKR